MHLVRYNGSMNNNDCTKELENNTTVCEETAVENEATVENAFAQPEFNTKKKGKLGLKIGLAATALVLAAAIVIGAFNFQALKGFFLKNLGSDEDYLRYVESKAFSSYTGTIVKSYGKLLSADFSKIGADSAASSSFTIELGEEALDLLEGYVGTDLEWLNQLEINVDTNISGDLTQFIVDLGMGGKQFLSLDAIMNMQSQEILVGMPNLSDAYISISESASYYDVSDDYYGGYVDDYDYGYGSVLPPSASSSVLGILESEYLPKLIEALPSEEVLGELIDKYIGIALDEIKNVSKSSTTLEIDDISEKVTVLKTKISEKTAINMLIAVLKEAKKDSEIKSIIKDFCEVLEDEGLLDDTSDIYPAYKDAVDSILDSLDEVKSEASSETVLVITSYIDSAHEVIGRKITMNDNDLLYYAVLTDGDDFECEYVSGAVKVLGSGKNTDGKVTAEYTLDIMDENYGKLVLTDFVTDTENDKFLNGTVEIYPSKSVVDSIIDSEVSSVVSLLDPGIKIDLKSEGNSVDIGLSIVSNGKTFFGIKSTAKDETFTEIETPSDLDIYETYEAMDWLATFDLEKLVDDLKNTDIPEEIVSAVEYYVELFNSYYDYYYGDGYYDYY